MHRVPSAENRHYSGYLIETLARTTHRETRVRTLHTDTRVNHTETLARAPHTGRLGCLTRRH